MPARLLFRNTNPLLKSRCYPLYSCRSNITCFNSRRTITTKEEESKVNEEPQKEQEPEQLPHISEEAADTSRITGQTQPDLEKGTSVKEILERDPKAKANAPQVLQDNGKQATPKGSRPYSTTTRRRATALVDTSTTLLQGRGEGQGHIFELPSLPLHSGLQMKKRYDPMVEQLTKQMMKDGKLGVAQRSMTVILNRLRTASPPASNPLRPLVLECPIGHLPLNPAAYLTAAVDSVAPLLRIKSLRGIAGGGATLPMPIPLTLRQRRRTAIAWILDAAKKKADKGISNGFANKVADEIIAIVEGRSPVWEKRQNVHKTGITSRSNLSTRPRR